MADLKESFLFSSVLDQSRHWYYAYKTKFIRQLLRRQLASRKVSSGLDYALSYELSGSLIGSSPSLKALDIGAGNGIISRSIGHTLDGTSLSWDLVDSEYPADQVDARFSLYREIPPDTCYDLIIAIDVVEHIQDDAAFIEMLLRHLNSEGLIMICVPAFQFLFGPHDIFLGHYRRYTLSSVTSLLDSDKVKMLNSGYLYVLPFPLVALNRLLKRFASLFNGDRNVGFSDMRNYQPVFNEVLDTLMKLELAMLNKIPILSQLFGVSVYVLGVKSSTPSLP